MDTATANDWPTLQQAIAREIAGIRRCDPCTPTQQRFRALATLDVGPMNRDVNLSIVATRDVTDHWQTPLETLERGKGDCEDYAILKLAVLAYKGIPATMFIVRKVHEDHAVIRQGTNTLDNLTHTLVRPLQGTLLGTYNLLDSN